MTKDKIWGGGSLATWLFWGTISGVVSTSAWGQYIVHPHDATWTSDNRGSGSAAITGSNPRSGNGSLEMHTTGALIDAGFYLRTAGDSYTAGWGTLSEIEKIGFDWYRVTQLPSSSDVPWLAQTPVLRLHVREGSGTNAVFSMLVWEKYYTDNSPTVNDQWITEDLSQQMFWRYSDAGGFTINGCSNIDPFFPHPLMTATAPSWGDGSHCYAPNDAVIWGISVGVGSNWPNEYLGYADNVQLKFANAADFIVNDNFELPVPIPAPATWALMVLGAVMWRVMHSESPHA